MNRIRFCPSGKIAYVRREDAKVQIRQARIVPPQYHRKDRRGPQTYYRCPLCGFYHVTGVIGTPQTGNRKPI